MKTLITTQLGSVPFDENCVQALIQLGHSQAEAEQFAREAVQGVNNDVVIEQRHQAFKREAEQLFVDFLIEQTPESEQAWRSKAEEIKARYPKPAA